MGNIIIVHIGIAIVKMIIWGPGSASQDVFSILFLYCAINRLDYCLVLFYIVTMIGNITQILVSFGMYIQVKVNNDAPVELPAGSDTNKQV